MDVTHTCVVTLHSPDKAILHARTDRLVAKEHGSVCLCPCASRATLTCALHSRVGRLQESHDVLSCGEFEILTRCNHKW